MEKFRFFFGLLVWVTIFIFSPNDVPEDTELEALPSTSYEIPSSTYFANLSDSPNGQTKLKEKSNSPVELPVRIRIQKINLDTPIEEVGYSSERDWLVPEDLPATPKKGLNVGGEKNVSIWGHRQGVFRRLGELQYGDEIIVDDAHGEHLYWVSKKQIVEPKDVWVMNATENFQITLITCDPIGSEKNRLILSANLW